LIDQSVLIKNNWGRTTFCPVRVIACALRGHDGLLFLASLVIHRGKLLVTNLALPLTPATGNEPEEGISRFTVSNIHLGR
jgi:hypothetical protein